MQIVGVVAAVVIAARVAAAAVVVVVAAADADVGVGDVVTVFIGGVRGVCAC